MVKEGKWQVEEKHRNLNDEHTNYDVLFKVPDSSFFAPPPPPPLPNVPPVSRSLCCRFGIGIMSYLCKCSLSSDNRISPLKICLWH